LGSLKNKFLRATINFRKRGGVIRSDGLLILKKSATRMIELTLLTCKTGHQIFSFKERLKTSLEVCR